MSSGAKNAHLAILRTAMNFAIRKGYLSKNPVLSLEFAIRPKLEITPLANDLVEAMLRHAAASESPSPRISFQHIRTSTNWL
jgi:hypothetical protein